MKRKTVLLFTLFAYFITNAQLQYFSPDAMNGYTLFLGEKLFLINNCGEEVHSWTGINPNYHVKLLPNGNIVYIDFGFKTVVEKNWENEVVNEVKPLDAKITLDYEVIVTPENNYLCVARYNYTQEEFIATGYNTDSIGGASHVDAIVEIDRNTGETLWLWDIMDHVVQERSDTIPNYGVVADHPELLNLDAISTFDWQFEEAFMINGFDYNPVLDQVVCSLRKMGEIVVIDHSTTTEEAASHQGGNSGKGGDILYRWGNPQNYDQGTDADQQLFYQHNPNWIYHGEHVGGIAIYDNGVDRPGISYGYDYSTAPIIMPPILADNSYELEPNSAFEPMFPIAKYGGQNDPNSFYSRFTSSNKVLQNGNVLVAVGDDQRVLEFLPDGTLVWEYDLATAFFTFRVEKYSEDYPAFEGRDLNPIGTIENPSSMVSCELVSSAKDLNSETFNAWVESDSRVLKVEASQNVNYHIELYNLNGSRIWSDKGTGLDDFQLPSMATGVYYISIIAVNNKHIKTLKAFVSN